MNLGQKLKMLQDTANAEKIAEQERAKKAVEEKRNQEIARAKNLFNSIKDNLFAQIEHGKLEPAMTIEPYVQRMVVREAQAAQTRWTDDPIALAFAEMVREFRAEGLEFYITDGHDGVGKRSWIVCRCKPEGV